MSVTGTIVRASDVEYPAAGGSDRQMSGYCYTWDHDRPRITRCSLPTYTPLYQATGRLQLTVHR
jgi:hypothetical protein